MENTHQKRKHSHFSLPLRKDPYKVSKESIRYTKHKKLLKVLQSTTDVDTLKHSHEFIHSGDTLSYEQRLARKYYDRLHKEYCLGDFSQYKSGRIGLRWRTEQECFKGKGQFQCGNLECDQTDLQSYEVHFRYKEKGEVKDTLVKIRVCKECSDKLFYGKKKKLATTPRESDDMQETSSNEKDSSLNGKEIENVWSKGLELEKTREEEMDLFLKEMFM